MGKRIYWILFSVLTATGLGAMIYFGLQPRPVLKIKISRFENQTVAVNSVLLRLREEIRKSPLLFLGVEPSRPEHLKIWKEFLERNQEEGSRYDEIVIEERLPSEDFPSATKLSIVEDFERFFEGTQNALAAGKRVVVLVPTIYSAQMITGSPAFNFKQRMQKGQLAPMSLSLTDFPRKRELEKEMIHPCVVEGVDQTGVGPFGCMVVQTARANYRKRFAAGDLVGLLEQVGLKDYLMLLTIEK